MLSERYAAVIATDAGPRHCEPASPKVTERNDDAAKASSDARPSQAVAANIGPDPAPANMRAELIPGGKTRKFIAEAFFVRPRHRPPASTILREIPTSPRFARAVPEPVAHELRDEAGEFGGRYGTEIVTLYKRYF